MKAVSACGFTICTIRYMLYIAIFHYQWLAGLCSSLTSAEAQKAEEKWLASSLSAKANLEK